MLTGENGILKKASNAKEKMIMSQYEEEINMCILEMQTVTDETKTLFMATGYTLNSSKNNSKCVSTLLNTNNWENFKDTENKALSAIGSPTIEMWMESWNKLYPNDKLYCNNTDSLGYYVGMSSEPTTKAVSLKNTEGYKNRLYFLYTGNTVNGTITGYWFSSPLATSSDIILNVREGGIISDASGLYYNGTYKDAYTFRGLRPIVALNSGITVDATD